MNIKKSVKTPELRKGALSESASVQVTPERILQRLEWQVIRRLDGLLQGDYRSLFYGYGVDFADLREYQPEDDIRYIDWNVTARMDTPYVRQYVEDREVTAWFLIDLSPSMDFGTTQNQKRGVLIDVVGTLARLLTRHGNRVGAILYTGQHPDGSDGSRKDHRIERVIPAKGGRNQVLRIINDLLNQPRLSGAAFTDLKSMLEGGLMTIKKRSLVFVLSDFISVPNWERPLNLLSQRHELLAVRLWDPREVELPDVGPIWLQDSETGEQLFVDTHDPRFRAQFAELARQRDAKLITTFRRVGVEPWSLSTSEDLVRAIVRYASVRKQLHRGGSSLSANPSSRPENSFIAVQR
jgi:uncharacterized protein (DUF58 family)